MLYCPTRAHCLLLCLSFVLPLMAEELLSQCPPGVVEVEADEIGKVIQSPGFPYHFPTDVLCQWRVKSNGDFVTVKVDTLDLKMDTYCSDDYLRIYDGHSSLDPVLRTFCSFEEPTDPFTSTINSIYIRFRSGSVPSYGKGFKLVVQSKEDKPAEIHPDNFSTSSGDESSDSDDNSKIYALTAVGCGFLIIVIAVIVLRICDRIQRPPKIKGFIYRPMATLPTQVFGTNSYMEAEHDKQHLMRPPEYTSRPSSNLDDNEAYEERAEGYSPQTTNDNDLI